MTIKELSLKERVLKRIEKMDVAQLLQVEKILDDFAKDEKVKRQLEALRSISGIITDPEEIAALERATQRRPFFGNRELDIEP